MLQWLRRNPLTRLCQQFLQEQGGETPRPSPGTARHSPRDFWALEPRMMFDGAALLDHTLLTDPQEHSAETATTAHHPEPAPLPPARPVAPTETAKERHEILFIDARVQDKQTLIDGVKPGVQVVELAANRDGVQQIAQVLHQEMAQAEAKPFTAIHIVSHGREGELFLGSAELSNDSLPRYAETLQEWGKTLTNQGDLLFYGCKVGGGTEGTLFVDRVSQLTGADVGASNDLTGAAAKGGNWNLEVHSGTVESSVLFSSDARQTYRDVLATLTVTNTNDTGAGSLRTVLSGSASGDTIQFSSSLYGQTITLTSGQLTISQNITIDGDMTDSTSGSSQTDDGTPNITIDAGGSSRVFRISSGTVNLTGLIITGGTSSNDGGGVKISGGTTTITNSEITGNTASGASNVGGGGIYNSSTLIIDNTKIYSNTTTGSNVGGAGIYNDSGSALTITDSMIYSNTASDNGGGIYVKNAQGTISLSNVLVASNTATGSGPDLYSSAGSNALTLTSSSGNFFSSTSGVSGATVTSSSTTTLQTISGIDIATDSGSSATDFITNTASQTITGTLSSGLAAGQTLYGSVDAGSNWVDVSSSVTGTAISWSSATLSGSSTIEFRVYNSVTTAYGTTATQTYTLDTTAPTTTIATTAFSADTAANSSTNSDFVTGTAAQTISGTLSAVMVSGESVYVSLDNGSTWTAATTTVGANTWSLAGQTLTGSNTLQVKVTDTAGNDGTLSSQAYTLDTTAPTTTIATTAFSADTAANSSTNSDFVTSTAAQTISGTLSAVVATGETVYVSLDNGSTWTAATTTVGVNTWSLAGQTLTGSNTLKVKVTDSAGNDGTVSSQAYTLDTTAPTTTIATTAFSADTAANSTTNSDFVTGTTAQTISGTLSAVVATGETVYVSLDNGSTWTAATTTVGVNTWSLAGQTLTGSNTLKVKVTDSAGNDGTVSSQAYTLDTTAPTTTIATTVFSADTAANSSTNSDFVTSTAAQTISGTLSAVVATGETVYVSLDNGSTWTAATTTVGVNTWSLAGQTLTGSNTLKVKVTDSAGNDGTVSSQAYTLDTTAPTTTIATTAFSADTAANSSTNSDFVTSTAAQTISGTLSAVVATGETVYVSLDNGSTWTAATTTVGVNTWSLAGQTLTGSNTLKVKVTDSAGNDGTVSSQAYTLDTTAPTTTIATTAFSADTAANSSTNSDFVTSTAAQTISG
ncbi:MAG: DUF4347 domain-containing protein, partial [Magnetococcus sp. XQGC-1]